LLPASQGLGAKGPRPNENVLFIAVDDLNHSLGCYGHWVVKSPNIDKLAARGIRFDRAYCQFPVCNPSRTSLLTGLRPDTTGVLNNNTAFRSKLPDVVTLPQLFRENGYFTARVGKIFHARTETDDPKAWDSKFDPKGTSRGKKGQGRNLTGGSVKWCRWLAADGDDEDQPDGQIAAEAIDLLERHRDDPFFIAVGFHKPHDPFVAPKRYFDFYRLEQMELVRDPADRSGEHPQSIGSGWKKDFDRFTDRDNTTVVFFSDHGYQLGEHGWWNKNTLYEQSARSPMIVVTPEMTRGGTGCSRIVEFVDIYPTLADLHGLPAPGNLEGTSFKPLLSNPNLPWKKAAFTQVQRGAIAGHSVRTDRWRYTQWDRGKLGAELYDHDSDPGEYYNLASNPEHARTIEELRKMLRQP